MIELMKVLLLILVVGVCVGCKDADGLFSHTQQSIYMQYKIDVVAGRNPTLEDLEIDLLTKSSHKDSARTLMLKLYKERANKVGDVE